uniref:Protein kinase domain-containing protein n=1 Tax=Panagrolaimus sp. PS1159 TaxID=55785 RepID=A0AC35FG39_9BILA
MKTVKEDVERAVMIPMNHPIKVVKMHEPKIQQLSVLYNNLRNVDISDFIIGEKIGGGGFSRIYEGKLDGETVAIKAALKEGRKSIHKELQIYDNIKHPNILQALGYHLAVDDLLFLPMRKFNLSEYFMNYNSIIENSQLIKYCIQITDAVKYLHQTNIIHCDLKTDNILVKDDKGTEIEITDFGCAVDLTRDNATRFNGTKTHMAYELLKSMYSPNPVNFRGTKATDVWAYAITIWQIFSKTEFLPCDFIKTELIIDNYEKGKKLPKPQEMPEKLWKYVFLQCFDLDPSGRPSMNEIYERIQKQLSLATVTNNK